MWQRWNGLRYLPEVPSILIVEGAGLGKKIHHTGKGLHFLKTSEGVFCLSADIQSCRVFTLAWDPHQKQRLEEICQIPSNS